MKILHCAFMMKLELGIINQMRWEVSATKSLGLKWTSKIYTPNKVDHADKLFVKLNTSFEPSIFKSKLFPHLKEKKKFYEWLETESKNYDIVLLRHSTANPHQYKFIKTSKTPIWLVHHTLEIPEIESADTFKSLLKSLVERFYGRKSIKNAIGIIGVTDEIINYELGRIKGISKPFLRYPNGILYDRKINYIEDNRDTNNVEIIFIASFFSGWHGLDMLLNELKGSTNFEFIIHIVGAVGKDDLELAGNDPRIKFHGLLSHHQIEKISAQCWIGLASFGLNRKSMNQACTLKVRDYLKIGLPVYSSHQDVFPDDFRYYRQGPLCIEKILSYAREMRTEDKVEISNFSKKFISKKEIVKKFHDQFCELMT
ncbi:glycosyltransferase [Alcaligenaceae bacterium]|nr:glycosyltransferase [Alcaligenaceae bacterium]